MKPTPGTEKRNGHRSTPSSAHAKPGGPDKRPRPAARTRTAAAKKELVRKSLLRRDYEKAAKQVQAPRRTLEEIAAQANPAPWLAREEELEAQREREEQAKRREEAARQAAASNGASSEHAKVLTKEEKLKNRKYNKELMRKRTSKGQPLMRGVVKNLLARLERNEA